MAHRTLAATLLAAALVAGALPPAQARAPNRAARTESAAPESRTLMIEAGLGRVIQLNGTATSVFAADPKVAEVRPASPTTLFVFGVAPGRTTIAAMDASGQPVGQYELIVMPSSYAAAAARGGIASALPGRSTTVDALGNGSAIRGRMASPAEAERAMIIARSYLPAGQTATNHLGVNSSIQVNLRVRVLEMSRTLTRDLGVNWSALATIGSSYATIGGATANLIANLTQPPATAVFSSRRLGINAVIDALAQDQLVHMLAEPNLTALSGQTATFLVGGEFPIPVAQQNNTTTIEFKQYGVSLAFVPTVISDGHINLTVRPEVSQLTQQGAITLSSSNASIQIPALSVRRAETTVDLGSGQSFAIAGLLQDNTSIANTGVPWLSDLPILGALFRSDAFQRNETELVIIVTPFIVRPVSDQTQIATPMTDRPLPTDFERLLLLRQTGRLPSAAALPVSGPAAPPLRRPIDAGFIVQ